MFFLFKYRLVLISVRLKTVIFQLLLHLIRKLLDSEDEKTVMVKLKSQKTFYFV